MGKREKERKLWDMERERGDSNNKTKVRGGNEKEFTKACERTWRWAHWGKRGLCHETYFRNVGCRLLECVVEVICEVCLYSYLSIHFSLSPSHFLPSIIFLILVNLLYCSFYSILLLLLIFLFTLFDLFLQPMPSTAQPQTYPLSSGVACLIGRVWDRLLGGDAWVWREGWQTEWPCLTGHPQVTSSVQGWKQWGVFRCWGGM